MYVCTMILDIYTLTQSTGFDPPIAVLTPMTFLAQDQPSGS